MTTMLAVLCAPPCPPGGHVSRDGQRKRLPAAWAGLRDDALATLTGVEGAVFCHPNRFIAGARTREGAVALATLAATA